MLTLYNPGATSVIYPSLPLSGVCVCQPVCLCYRIYLIYPSKCFIPGLSSNFLPTISIAPAPGPHVCRDSMVLQRLQQLHLIQILHILFSHCRRWLCQNVLSKLNVPKRAANWWSRMPLSTQVFFLVSNCISYIYLMSIHLHYDGPHSQEVYMLYKGCVINRYHCIQSPQCRVHQGTQSHILGTQYLGMTTSALSIHQK